MSSAQQRKAGPTFKALWNAVLLPAAERRFAFRAWLLAPILEQAVRRWGLDGTLEWVRRVPPKKDAKRIEPQRAEQLVTQVCAHQPLVRGQCLPMALTQFALHQRDGCDATLVVGVRRDNQQLAAHAWVEPSGQSVQLEQYASIMRVETGV